ncbi:hypothetical protein PTKIN_Ptkin13bG0297000 [Pterospermum kingtungense]
MRHLPSKFYIDYAAAGIYGISVKPELLQSSVLNFGTENRILQLLARKTGSCSFAKRRSHGKILFEFKYG